MSSLTLEQVYTDLTNPKPRFLELSETFAYILSELLKGDAYGTGLINGLDGSLQLSDTVLYKALKVLEAEGMVDSYMKKVEGRGRPRRMFRLIGDRQTAEKFAEKWQGIVGGGV